MTDRIEVFCDDPRHAGIEAEVETFVRLAPDGEWITAEQFGQGRPQQTGWRDHNRDTGEPVHSYRCGECPPRKRPQQFECTDTPLQWLLNAVADLGMSQPTVRILNLLLSNPTTQ